MQRKLLLFLALLLLVTVTPVSAQDEVEYEVTYTSDIYQYGAEIGIDTIEDCISPNIKVSNPFDDPPEVEAGKVAKHNISYLTDMIVEIRITEIGGNPSDKEMDVFVDFHHTGLQVALLYVNDGDTLSRGLGIEYCYADAAAESLHITLTPADPTEPVIYEAKVTLYWSVQWVIEDILEDISEQTDYTGFLIFVGLAVAVMVYGMSKWRD